MAYLPFQLLPGAINDITFGCVWAPQPVGGCPSTNFNEIKDIDDQAQALFDNNFKTVEGPEAPRMVVRALDRHLVFYLVNDYGSNNFGENYGNTKGTYKDSLQYHQPVVKAHGFSDSLYVFQGYRVFQIILQGLMVSPIVVVYSLQRVVDVLVALCNGHTILFLLPVLNQIFLLNVGNL